VTIIPSPPFCGTSTSAVIVYDLFRMLGAFPRSMPDTAPEYVKFCLAGGQARPHPRRPLIEGTRHADLESGVLWSLPNHDVA
jgi:hypothetical protein